MRRLVFTRLAEADLNEILDYIARRRWKQTIFNLQ